MKVICKQTTSGGFDLEEVVTVFSNNFDYSFGGHGIELNGEYTVMGILTYKETNCLYYLIDVDGKPDWFPYKLFKVSDNSLPKEWFVNINGKEGNSGVSFVCGFSELCNEVDFYDKLLEREEKAMQTYFTRKAELKII